MCVEVHTLFRQLWLCFERVGFLSKMGRSSSFNHLTWPLCLLGTKWPADQSKLEYKLIMCSIFFQHIFVLNIGLKRVVYSTYLYYYLNCQVYFGYCHIQHHTQTIHPIENFISMNLLQMSWVITWAQKKNSASNLKKKMRLVFRFNF